MAKGTKPGSKPEAKEEVVEAAPKKSKKKLIIIVVALVLLLAVGAVAALLLLKPAHPTGTENTDAAGKTEITETPAEPAKFIDLGTFTTNLSPEEGDRFIQVSISLKISRAELETMVTASTPEIKHRVNMLLQSKLPSELATAEGKNRLAAQIKVQIQYVLGLRKTAPLIGSAQMDAPTDPKVKGGLDEVLFTSFIIQ